MSEKESAAGTFVWRDIERARDFYTKVVGWTVGEGPNGVAVFKAADGSPVADLQKAEHRPTTWATYVVVESADAAVERVKQLGGEIVVPPFDIPEVGRIAFFADPQGAHLGLFQGG